MWQRISRWYNGEGKTEIYENDPDSYVVMMPYFYVEYHWTAKLARTLVHFYCRHWQFVWSIMIAVVGAWISYLGLKSP